MYLRVSPTKVVVRFGKGGKFAPRFIGPYEILERISDLAYRLALPPTLSRVHNVFHVSQLRKYILDVDHILEVEPLHVQGTGIKKGSDSLCEGSMD